MAEVESQNKRLLLISNSTLYGSGYLDHAEKEIRDFLGPIRRMLFVPFALHDRNAYAAMARQRLKVMEYELDSVHEATDPKQSVEAAEAVFIGGGNTFRLLKSLYDFGLLGPIRRKVSEGMPYLGSSAGSIVACPTLKTTKDMPIVQPPSFDALGLVGFQISPHYLDPDPNSTHMGETQEERINVTNRAANLSVVARAATEAQGLAGRLRNEAQAVDPQIPASNTRAMEQFQAASVAARCFNLALTSVFAGATLLLAAAGLYAVISYTVTQRTREIGVRMALGAQMGAIRRLVIGQGIKLALVGMALGLGAAFAFSRWMSSLLFNVSAIDPLTFIGVAAMLLLVATLACWIPARRATKEAVRMRIARTLRIASMLKVTGLCFVLAGILLATPTAARAQSSRAKSAASYFTRGSEWHARGEFDRAIADYGIAITFDPHFAQAYYARARARLSKGEGEAALADFNHALELDPRHVAAYNDRGYVLSKIGQNDAALADFNRALELNPRFVRAYYNRAFIRILQRDFEEAFADFDRVIEIDKKHAAAYNGRGYARAAMGDHEGAFMDFNRAIKLDPQYVSAYCSRGNLRFSRGDYDGAIADHSRAIELSPRLAENYNNRANARYAKHDYEGALTDYYQALALNPRYAEVYANRGMLWLRLKKTSEARADFAQCVALKPEMKSSLEERINHLQAQLSTQTR